MEAVLERPMDEASVPEFNDEEWDRQFGAVGGPEPELKTNQTTLAEALALPVPMEDLWPGHVYIPPRIKRLEEMIKAANEAEVHWQNGELLEAADAAANMIQPIVRRQEGSGLAELSKDDIKEEFDVLELIRICHHVLQDQGLTVEGVSGNAPSGRSIGVKNFHSSAAITEPTTSTDAETSPSSS